MHESFVDITSRIEGEATWWDQNGTPRYGEFTPERCPNIYSDQVVLLRIECQACGREFDVELHNRWIAPLPRPKELHYGDPPAHDCVGDSMNCEDLEVLEVWVRERAMDGWTRRRDQEGPIE